jgi:hypothetical protein
MIKGNSFGSSDVNALPNISSQSASSRGTILLEDRTLKVVKPAYTEQDSNNNSFKNMTEFGAKVIFWGRTEQTKHGLNP